jgi:hypothetical protein
VAINKRAHIFHQFILSTPPTLEELEDFGRIYLAPVARSGEAISFLTYLNDSSTTEIEDDAMKERSQKLEEHLASLLKSSTEKTPVQIKMAEAKAKKAKEHSGNRPFSIKEVAAWTALNFKDIEAEEEEKIHAIMDAWAHCEEFHIQCGSDVIQEYLTLQLAARGYSRAIAIMKDTGIIVPSGLGLSKNMEEEVKRAVKRKEER